jgi:phenylpropionate dioxygenase-like ring-hydroxylating dioxygenase large terminal subunit
LKASHDYCIWKQNISGANIQVTSQQSVLRAFNNPGVVVQSWYVVALSREVRRGEVISRDLLNRRIAIYRGEDGRVQALDARCPHLGADLGQGSVVGNRLRCAFHHWSFARNGQCVEIPYMDSLPSFARTFAYPTEEKYGAIWIFNGPRALFPIPSFSDWREEELLAVRLKPQRLNCHPHVVTCNGLDVQHFKTVHELEFVEEPVAEELDDYRIRLKLKIRLRGRTLFERSLRLLEGEKMSATFTTWGGNMATIEGKVGPIPLLVLFTQRGLRDGGSASQTFLFVPRHQALKRLFRADRFLILGLKLIMGYILVKDRQLLDTLNFRANLVSSDAPLAAFIRQVNAMAVFDPDRDLIKASPEQLRIISL